MSGVFLNVISTENFRAAFSHAFGAPEAWILKRDEFKSGTSVWMKLDNRTARREQKNFDQYTGGDDYGFNKTVVAVKLAQYGEDKLISRSQGKRVLSRVELFKVITLNCQEVEAVSMGRRNTRSKPKRRAFSSQGSFASVDSTEHLPG